MTNYFTTLGVPPAATAEEIRAAYKQLAVEHHPDKGGLMAVFQDITRAYAVLKTEEGREQHKKELCFLYDPCFRCMGQGVLQRNITFTAVTKERCTKCGGAGFLER